MNLFSAKLDRLEAHIKTLIEGHLAGLLPTRKKRDRFLDHLLNAMKNGTQVRADGIAMAPDVYVLLVHPDLSSRLESNTSFLKELSAIIQQIGGKNGLQFAHDPRIYVSPNTDIPKNSLDVVARISQEGLSETAELTTRTGTENSIIPMDAFLIVNGARIFPLELPVINIGRRDDNDLIINDPRVSRTHAQLRAVHGKYILFDLDSKGGTFVNGQPVVQQILMPQDVISLAGVPLVFNQQLVMSAGLDQTQEMLLSTPSDQPDDKQVSHPDENQWSV